MQTQPAKAAARNIDCSGDSTAIERRTGDTTERKRCAPAVSRDTRLIHSGMLTGPVACGMLYGTGYG
ncbi:hypothetical protein P2L35_12340 [Enterococcus faecium]|uniref:hypothetical protein n=1 Tax=Enterococcus faecium TaxID=1352 RepID=UPI0025AF6C9D|nr:hypothetical protein [Enterococcus faecium]MDN3040487.1 hypothetical protein [Enterococcus faecium]